MLSDLSNSVVVAENILIKDSFECSGKPLFDKVFKFLKASSKFSNAAFVGLDLSPSNCPDPLAPEYDSRLKPTYENISAPHLTSFLLEELCVLRKDICLFLNGLEFYLLNNRLSELASIITKIKKTPAQCQLVCLTHMDCFVGDELALESFFGLTMCVQPTVNVHQFYGECSSVLRKPTGKVIKATECFSFVAETGEIRAIEKKSESVANKVIGDTTDPTKDLTFNLKLTSEQKVLRGKVPLPYWKKDDEKEKLSKGSGKIYYHYDDVDDFDEEDPDDDLDI